MTSGSDPMTERNDELERTLLTSCSYETASAVWPGRTSDGVLPGLFSATLVDPLRDARGTQNAPATRVMRSDPDDEGKKPAPVKIRKKGTNTAEGDEANVPLRKDAERDRHRHVC